jgi:hypothetical protein
MGLHGPLQGYLYLFTFITHKYWVSYECGRMLKYSNGLRMFRSVHKIACEEHRRTEMNTMNLREEWIMKMVIIIWLEICPRRGLLSTISKTEQ